MGNIKARPAHIGLSRVSCTGDGMHLELCIADANGKCEETSDSFPIATIRADKGDQRKCVFYSDHGPVSVPLCELADAIRVAEQEVHSEEYYD